MGQSVAVLDHFSPLTITFDHKALEMTVDTDKITEIVTAALLPLLTTMDAQAELIAGLRKTMDDEAEAKKAEAEEEKEGEADKEKKATEDATAIALKVIATQDEIAKKVTSEIILKDELVKLSSPLVGTFDHSAMTASCVAVYAAEKLKLSGDPETALRAYAIGLGAKPTATLDNAPAGDHELRSGAYN
jgi:hypothetical protein